MTFRQVCDAIEGNLAAVENRTPHSIFHPKRKYSLRWIKLAYKQEKALQAFETLYSKHREAPGLSTTSRKG